MHGDKVLLPVVKCDSMEHSVPVWRIYGTRTYQPIGGQGRLLCGAIESLTENISWLNPFLHRMLLKVVCNLVS